MNRPRFLSFWRDMSLRTRLVVTVAAVILIVQLGDVLLVLSREVADLDYRVASEGTILAQGISAACATMIDGTDPQRFDGIIERLRGEVDLVALAVANRDGIIVGGSDPSQLGRAAPRRALTAFNPPRRSPGLDGLFRRYTEYTVSAPILHGTEVRGVVWFGFRSREVPNRATELIVSAVGIGGVWVVLAGVIASLYVRRITAPLSTLTDGLEAVSENRVDEVRLEEPTSGDELGRLQHTFKRLLTALREQQHENARLLADKEQLNERLRGRVDDMSVDLARKTAYLEAVLACMEEGVITCDLEGRIVQANAGAERQLQRLGLPEAGRDIAEVVPGAQRLRPAVEEAMRAGERTVTELHFGPEHPEREAAITAHPEDDHRTLVFRAYPLRGGAGEALGALLIVTDVTQERGVERQLRRHDRLISLGTLAAGLAHELGNYMHTINGFSSLLLRDTPPDAPGRKNVEAIRRDSTQAIALLERFLQFARPGSVQRQAEPVERLLRESLDLCGYRLRTAGVQVELDVRTPDQRVSCDRRLMSQVFVNLALNAVDAMKGRPSPRLTVAARAFGNQVDISVADNGCGISAEHIEHIFDPFFTTKQAEGTGLGLSIANQIVEIHGGRLFVESRPEEGATFHVVLPAESGRAAA